MYEKMMKGSDELGCTSIATFYDDDIIKIDNSIYFDKKRYRKDEVEHVIDNWEKYFKEKPDLKKILEVAEPEHYDDDRDDLCDFDAECIIDILEKNATTISCSTDFKFNFDDKVKQVCKYYRQPYVNAHDETSAYGGHEEGGWWYKEGRCIESVPVFSKEDAKYVEKMLEGLKYRCNGKLKINSASCAKGSHYPRERPYYS